MKPPGPTSTQFPFKDLLEALRERGLRFGADAWMDLARFASAYDGSDPREVCNGIKSILAKNSCEARVIEEVVTTLYLDPRPPESVHTPDQPVRPSGLIRYRHIARALFLLALVGLVWALAGNPTPDAPVGELTRSFDDDNEINASTSPPALPPPPVHIERRDVVFGVIAASLLLLMFLHRRESRTKSNQVLREHCLKAMEDAPPPHSYRIEPASVGSFWPDATLDEAASDLVELEGVGRIGGELDVAATLAATLESGGSPTVVLKPRRVLRPLVVLEDRSLPGEFQQRLDSLLVGLSARGVVISRWSFHGVPLSLYAGDNLASIEELSRQYAQSPVMVASSGQHLQALALHSGASSVTRIWDTFQQWGRLSWLHPLDDTSQHPAVLQTSPFQIHGLSPDGVMAAVASSCGRPDQRREALQRTPATEMDVALLRHCLAYLPINDLAVLDYLRRTEYPYIPQDAAVIAWETGPLRTHPGVGPTDQEIRESILEILRHSEPPVLSLAHDRWVIDRAFLELHIAAKSDAAAATLASMAHRPSALYIQEGLEAAHLAADHAPAHPFGRRRVQWMETALEQRGESLRQGRTRIPFLAPPGLRPVSAALAFFLVSWGTTHTLGIGRRVVIPHETGVWRLNLEDGLAGREPGAFRLRITRKESNAPSVWGLYEGVQPVDKTLEEHPEGSEGAYTLDRTRRARWFQVRAALPTGALALSNPVWVPEAVDDIEVVEPAPPDRPVVEPPGGARPKRVGGSMASNPTKGTSSKGQREKRKEIAAPGLGGAGDMKEMKMEAASTPTIGMQTGEEADAEIGTTVAAMDEVGRGQMLDLPDQAEVTHVAARLDASIKAYASALHDLDIRRNVASANNDDLLAGCLEKFVQSFAQTHARLVDLSRQGGTAVLATRGEVDSRKDEVENAERTRNRDLAESTLCGVNVLRLDRSHCLDVDQPQVPVVVHSSTPPTEPLVVVVLYLQGGLFYEAHKWLPSGAVGDSVVLVPTLHYGTQFAEGDLRVWAYVVDRTNLAKVMAKFSGGSPTPPYKVFDWKGAAVTDARLRFCGRHD